MSDVVVVGAGIGGAVLALALGRRGWKVKLLEREVQPARIVRPEVLWGATPSVLDQFGIGEVIRSQASVRLEGVHMMYGRRRLLSISLQRDIRAAAKVEAYSTDPGLTREVIASAAAATGNVSFERGVEVKQLLREHGRIVGVQASRDGTTLTEHARLVVGDDGANSIVRGAIAPHATFSMFPLDFITAALAWPAELPQNQARVWFNPKALRAGIPVVGCLPWPGGRGVLLLPVPHTRALALREGTAHAFWDELRMTTPVAAMLSASLKFPEDFRWTRRPYGHAPGYVADGAAIIGDAAHPVSPAGGQGANAAIWDALALAEVADEALSANDLRCQRLARYEALRRPRNRDSVRITELVVGMFRYAAYVPGLPWFVPLLLRCIDSVPGLKSRLIPSFATTFVTRPLRHPPP